MSVCVSVCRERKRDGERDIEQIIIKKSAGEAGGNER